MAHDRRDNNEVEIVKFWSGCGCLWVAQSRTAGFDGILIDRTGLYIVEIKNPSRKYHLTPAEMQTKLQIEDIGGEYHIITSIEEAAALIGMGETE
jgi:hypothetical protein